MGAHRAVGNRENWQPQRVLVTGAGAIYHSTPVAELDLAPDVVLVATGVGAVIADVLDDTGRNAVVCLAGVSSPGRRVGLDRGALNR